MTRSTAAEVERRRPAPPTRRARPEIVRETFAGDLARAVFAQAKERHTLRWPSARYRADPVAFFREILGVNPWSRQIEVIEAIRDHKRVAVKSGHKVAKSHTAAGIALWFYCSFPDARVVMSSTTARQVDEILWRELSMMRARAGRCVSCKQADPSGRTIPRPCPHSAIIDGDIGLLARTGLKSDDFREIVGFTAREAEAVAGISGANLLYLVDEASGVPDVIFEAMEGNRAGGARIVMFSNPTRTEGTFFDAFHEKADFYRCITISSEETPNVTGLEPSVPGLADPDWIEEKRREWGADSPLYKVRVKGEFATREDGKIFSIETIIESIRRHRDAPATGRLYVGLDPAGETGTGDDTAFVARRGARMLSLVRMRGLNPEAHIAHLFGFIAQHRAGPRETPVVVLDREGSIGAKLYGLLLAVVDSAGGTPPFELVGIRSSDRAHRTPAVYDRARDELTSNLEAWIRSGGAIIEDAKLEKELHAVEWYQATNGRVKVTAKDDLRKALGRSPDAYDALALSCWEPLSLRIDDEPDAAASPAVRRLAVPDDTDEGGALDPYAGEDEWERLRNR